MQNNFSIEDLKKFKRNFSNKKISDDLLERVYTSRLLGQNSNLVLHGGGNTSVKSQTRDVDGILHNIIYVKGSGSDLATIKAADFPAVKLKPLLNILKKRQLSDEQMVGFLRKNLINIKSSNPSVETLVHALIKEKFVDHTHATPILEITNRKDGMALCKKIFADEVLIIPYTMPGFILAKKVSEIYKYNPRLKGLILYKHGIFTFGETGEESYNRMISLVSKAERFLKSESLRKLKSIPISKRHVKPEAISPIIRGLVSSKYNYIVNFRTGKDILEVINSQNAKKILSKGVVTPDHVLRIKPKILVVNIDDCKNHDHLKRKLSISIKNFIVNYKIYFNKFNKPKLNNIMLDPIPQIIAIQNVGLFCVGQNKTSAIINGDIAETSIKTIGSLEKRSSFYGISMKDIFDVEYWSLEQAKLKKQLDPMNGKVTVITGGMGTIGLAVAKKFREKGSEVILLDINTNQIKNNKLSKNFKLLQCDVTKRTEFKKALSHICLEFGGIDYVVSNAGSAVQNEIAEISDKKLKNSFEINFFAHQIVASESVKIMKKQNIGGCLLFNISKQSINPGKNFGAYGTSKAALLALCRQYALEYGNIGIRSNGINADRIQSGLLTKAVISGRAKARSISPNEYLSSNLLSKQVLAEDVAQAFYNLSTAEKTTAAVLTVDGGNIAASLR